MEDTKKTNIKPDRNSSSTNQALFDITCGNFALFTQTQGAHWNYVGPDFASVHVLFEQQYQNLYVAVDELAERLRALGERAPGDICDMEKRLTELKWFKSVPEGPTSMPWIQTLIANHTSFTKALAEAIGSYEKKGDTVTHDMLVSRKQFHDKTLWMLHALVSESNAGNNNDRL